MIATTLASVRHDLTLISADDLHLFNEGTHRGLDRCLGAHLDVVDGVDGAWFGVWAPDAAAVSVVGDWNGWHRGADPLVARHSSGIWEGFVGGARHGQAYKYRISSRATG